MSSRIRSRSLCSRLSRQGFPCSWCGLGAVLLFVMAYPPVAETSSEEIPVLFSTTSQEHTPFTFLQESGQNLIYETDYQNDALDNLTRVDQKGNDPNSANWRTRTFVYNSLSQLTNATNPESGTITYTYD